MNPNNAINTIATPVAQNSTSQAAGIVGYNAGGGAIYGNPITTQDLQPTQPLKLPTATVPTVPSSLGGAIQASVNTNKTELQRYLDEQQQLKDTTGKDLKTMMGEIMGTTNEIANAPSSVDRTAQNKAREEIDIYTNQIEQEQLANRRLIENLQKNNPQGAFGGALTDRIQNIERDSLSKQADLAIMQSAATRKFTTAKDIADQQVQLKLEPLKAKLDNLKFFYSENKEQFNKADDRLFQTKIKQEERVYQREEKTLQQIADIKFNAVKNGAPLSVINRLAKAKTVDEALAFAGNYNTDPLDRAIKNAQLRKLNTESSGGGLTSLNTTEYSKFTSNPNYKAIVDGRKYQSALENYKNAIKKWGTGEVISSKGRGELGAAYSLLVATTKDYYTLGTLDSGVEKLVDLGLPKPNNIFKRDKKALSAADSILSGVTTNIQNAITGFDSSPYANTVEYQSLKLPPQTDSEYLDTISTALQSAPLFYNQGGY